MMERHFDVLLRNVPRDGSTVDLQRLFFNFTMDTATEFLLGSSTHTLDPSRSGEREAKFVTDYLVCCVEAVRQIQMGPLRGFSVNRQADGARQRAWAYIDRFVEDALEMRRSGKLAALDDGGEIGDGGDGATVKYNFLRELARDTDDRDMLRDQILNVLLASRDTTAGLLSNLFFMLARHPEAYAKLRAEVEDMFHGELPTEEELKNMPYLRHCINECTCSVSAERCTGIADLRNSLAPSPCRASQHAPSRCGYEPSRWRWAGRLPAPFCCQRNGYPVLRVLHAPS